MTVLADALPLRAATAVTDELSAALALTPSPEVSDDYGPSSPRWRDQSLSKGAAGVGLGGGDPMHAWLVRATHEDLSAGREQALLPGARSQRSAVRSWRCCC